MRQGDTITPLYNPTIAKIICWGQTRAEAIQRTLAALQGTVVAGLKSNLAFLTGIVEHPILAQGETPTSPVEVFGPAFYRVPWSARHLPLVSTAAIRPPQTMSPKPPQLRS